MDLAAAAAGDVVSDVRADGRKLEQREADVLTSVAADAVLLLQHSNRVHYGEHYCRTVILKLSFVYFTAYDLRRIDVLLLTLTVHSFIHYAELRSRSFTVCKNINRNCSSMGPGPILHRKIFTRKFRIL